MKIRKRYIFVLLVSFALLVSLLSACVRPGYTTYKNEEFGYTISYPMNWKYELSEDGTKCLLLSPTRHGSVMVDVTDAMSTRVAANYLLISIAQGTPSKEVSKLEDKPMDGFWNWYLSYEYETDFDTFHGEAFFKVTDAHLYKLDTAARVGEYEDFPFSEIISSFKVKEPSKTNWWLIGGIICIVLLVGILLTLLSVRLAMRRKPARKVKS